MKNYAIYACAVTIRILVCFAITLFAYKFDLFLMRSDSFKASAALDIRPGPGTGAVVKGPEDDGVGGKPDDVDADDNPIFSATLDGRRRVYGHDVFPHRASKSLLELMWMALKDKSFGELSSSFARSP